VVENNNTDFNALMMAAVSMPTILLVFIAGENLISIDV